MLRLKRQHQKNKLAPHKPLLLLVAIGATLAEQELEWLIVKHRLGDLLNRFTNSKKQKAYEPFMRLTRDEGGRIWVVDGVNLFKADGNVNVSELNKQNPRAHLHEEFIATYLKKPAQLKMLVQWLLEDFPDGIHQEILEEVNIEVELAIIPRTALTKKFRADVMNAYNHQCAVCGFGGRIDNNIAIGVDAAHIRMSSKNGPDAIINGMALCSLHHKLFDSGAFCINDDFTVEVSFRFGGTEVDALLDYHKKEIRLPRNPSNYPDKRFLAWQKEELFRA